MRKIYTGKNDAIQLKKVFYVAHLDKNTAEYRSECYSLAAANGFFKVAHPTAEAQQIYTAYDASGVKDIRNDNAPALFYKNEKRTNIDVKPVLAKMKAKNVRIYALYGKQDGIFSAAQINSLRQLVGTDNFKYLDSASHYLFTDRQEEFLNSMEKWVR